MKQTPEYPRANSLCLLYRRANLKLQTGSAKCNRSKVYLVPQHSQGESPKHRDPRWTSRTISNTYAGAVLESGLPDISIFKVNCDMLSFSRMELYDPFLRQVEP